MLAADIERVIENEVKRQLKQNSPLTLPVYGYPSKERNGGLGCDVISGSDHGQGASRCVSKINL